jgi:demethylmenaquinone methyltransferase/2-methoxy-6-polyprenyl-1,4-benzoquinol methylase
MVMNTQTAQVKNRYKKIARYYDKAEFLVENMYFKKIRKETLSKLQGDILEIGIGTGKNIPYYNRQVKLTGIDISPEMLKKAKQKFRNKALIKNLTLMDAQDLDFADNSFDYVAGTFIFCSIPDPVKALREARRVAKPEAQLIFAEHVLSKYQLIAFLENLLNPLVSSKFGFNINRDTRRNIQKAGLKLVKDERLGMLDVFRRFTCKK